METKILQQSWYVERILHSLANQPVLLLPGDLCCSSKDFYRNQEGTKEVKPWASTTKSINICKHFIHMGLCMCSH